MVILVQVLQGDIDRTSSPRLQKLLPPHSTRWQEFWAQSRDPKRKLRKPARPERLYRGLITAKHAPKTSRYTRRWRGWWIGWKNSANAEQTLLACRKLESNPARQKKALLIEKSFFRVRYYPLMSMRSFLSSQTQCGVSCRLLIVDSTIIVCCP